MEEDAKPLDSASTDLNQTQELPSAEENDSTPWYLRVQDEQEAIPTLLEKQQLPDIPADAPKCLQSMIDYLSRDTGLDYLSLIDLRKLEPPPAFGKNLMMVLGTARSEKHLNVSADRFCRWLRSTHKLQPHADGLLGRNELKIKLRRKARRAKLLGGRQQLAGFDDGISTGWICVDVGPIGEGQVTETVVESDEGGISGFGQTDDRVRFVVQMLTESRRAELELEDLWTGFVERQQAREQRYLAEDEDIGGDSVEEDATPIEPSHAPPVAERSTRVTGTLVQSRAFSGWAPRRFVLAAETGDGTLNSPRSLDQSGTAEVNSKRDGPQSRTPDNADSLAESLRYLESLPDAEALQALGKGWQDQSSTPFLKSFYGNISLFPGEAEWTAQFRLMELAQRIGHPGYDTRGLMSLLHQMEESCVDIPATIYDVVLRSVAASRSNNPSKDEAQHLQELEAVLTLMENMTLRNITTESRSLIAALTSVLWEAAMSEDEKVRSLVGERAASTTLLHALEQGAAPEDEHLALMAMQELASQGDWPAFWDVWRSFPVRELSRSANLYAAMFRLVAAGRHQTMAIEALTAWVPEMEHERPPVVLQGRVALAVMVCLKAADPQVDAKAIENPDSIDQWVRLFRKCYDSFAR